jgi:LEA14-like dessication related protein
MRTSVRTLSLWIGVLATGLTGCATTLENFVKSPNIELSNVQVVGLGFSSQTFLLSFDVSNPNPFSLPVSSVSYSLKLDGHRFASGETPSAFSVPANGDTQFAISVDLNMLQTAPQLLSVIRQSVRRDVRYELEGKLAVDIPLAPPVSYRNTGAIRLSGAAL